jgi:hypothetical protein
VTTLAREELGAQAPQGLRTPWTCLILCWVYFFVSFYGTFRTAAIFKSLFEILNLELPLLTRFLIASYGWFCPLLFISVVALTVAKQFFVIETKRDRIINVYLVVVAVFAAPVMIFVLYLPLLNLIHKLNPLGKS